MNWRPPRILVLSWVALLALLALTTFLAYQPLGTFNLPIALFIATLKALIVAAVFMELKQQRDLRLVFAGAGFFWLAIFIGLASTDYITRLTDPSWLLLPD
jgi:cytochrome c oxidase subunit 4